MSDLPSPADFGSVGPGFDSRECVLFISDGPDDPTICPPTALLLRIGRAAQEQLARCQTENGSKDEVD